MQPLDLVPVKGSDCFALLDDSDSSTAASTSRLYTGHIDTLTCHDPSRLPGVLDEMQRSLRLGLHAVGLFPYELGERMHGITPHHDAHEPTQILLFERCARLAATEVETWLQQRIESEAGAHPFSSGTHAGIVNADASVSEEDFHRALAAIRAYIEAGDTYQTNYTYRLFFDAYGSPTALYMRLRARQPVPYGALVNLPDGRTVLSFSPELFVRHSHGTLTARPMKGTQAASGDDSTDSARSALLASDPKNRAENLMIVDLLRNDLGRIAIPGSVAVPELFEVKRYGSVLQMTSTVTARVPGTASLADMFAALYPCGSITGAPKRRTMQIIREIETTPRGIYTGAIGWFDAPHGNQAAGEFCMSVPIRTLLLEAPRENGLRAGEMGVGAGIVHDSRAADEFAECRLKAGFLTGLPVDFDLFETMHATYSAGCRHVERHLHRLRRSAACFGFRFDEAAVRKALADACAILAPDNEYRLKLTLKQDGTCTVQTSPLTPLQGPVTVLLSGQAVAADDIFLHHKTTVRERYDNAWRAAESQGAFDMLFYNTRGELTEGARSSVFVKLDGGWHTPPLTAGVLPGVMRAVILADPAWNAGERTLTLNDLRAAEEVVFCNALRGVLPAKIDWRGHAGAERN
jgi:para-aminobenzoate synthetase/4-amino-4-deoxychorismate lyase